jgi:riboflavin biosynthesis pyrimidine reductase
MDKKSRITCHMVISRNGKITGSFLESEQGKSACEKYYEMHRNFDRDAFACGRITMDQSFTCGYTPDLKPFENTAQDTKDYIACTDAKQYAIAFDRKAGLGWKKCEIEDEDPGYDRARIIEVVCENASPKMLAYYRSIGVSYIFAGKEDTDLPLALNKLQKNFGIEKILLEGGGAINSSFEKAGLIDAFSLLMVDEDEKEEETGLLLQAPLHSYDVSKLELFTEPYHYIHLVKSEKETKEDPVSFVIEDNGETN